MANLKVPVEGKIEVDFADEAKVLLKQFVRATEKACDQIVWHEIKKEGLPPPHKKVSLKNISLRFATRTHESNKKRCFF